MSLIQSACPTEQVIAPRGRAQHKANYHGQAETMLRDMAFVYHLTERVKKMILTAPAAVQAGPVGA